MYSATGSYGWQADKIQVNFNVFKNLLQIKFFNSLLHLAKLHHYYSSMNAFKLVFLG